jgi:hypothetical protein
MRGVGKMAGYIGVLLTVIGVVLFWSLNWVLGLVFTVFVLAVAAWHLRMKREGNAYLKEVAGLAGCDFHEGELGYGRVTGTRGGHEIEITVNSDYDSLQGLGGFVISEAILDSAVGALARIKNFTSIKVKHGAEVEDPMYLDERTYIDGQVILFLPTSNKVTGLPELKPEFLLAKIDEIVEKAEELTG